MRSSRSVRAAGAVALAVVCPSCAPGLMKLPSTSGPPASDAAAIVRQLSTTCSSLEPLTAEIGVSGSIQGRRVRARLLAGVTSDAARLEAVAPVGQPFFIFVAHGDDSTLLLPRDSRILAHGQPRDVMEAVAGVALTPRELLEALTGCAPLRAVRPISAPTGGRFPEPPKRSTSIAPSAERGRSRLSCTLQTTSAWVGAPSTGSFRTRWRLLFG